MVLNGPPRSGKSSIAAVIQETFDGPWLNLGVDVFSQHVLPPRLRPGIGLRPGGGERPDIEALIPDLYAAFYESVAAHSRHGLNVVADVGHHDAYSVPLGVLPDMARRLRGLPALLVGVRCPLDVIMKRRDAGQPGRAGWYATSGAQGEVPASVLRWQHHVHQPGIYDVEVDTSVLTPAAAASLIRERLAGPAPSAFRQLADEEKAGHSHEPLPVVARRRGQPAYLARSAAGSLDAAIIVILGKGVRMRPKRREQLTAVLRPLLQPDEPIEVMAYAGVGSVSVRRTTATAVVTGVLSGGTMMLVVSPKGMFIALSNRRLFFVDVVRLTGRPRRLVMEIPRNAVRTEGLRKGPLGLTLRTTLVDGSERGLTIVFAHPAKADGRALTAALPQL